MFEKEEFAKLERLAGRQKCMLVDIAVPRNVDPAIDESPDLSANFFSNEDSSDSGDVPIRMSGSLPDIPAETLFKGSVLEDDGFFDEDDFEDVGNGEDVADLFA